MTMDINYLAAGGAEQPVPFKVSGSCEGSAKLMQRCITLLLSDCDAVLRPEAAGIYDKLKSAAVQESTLDVIRNMFTQDVNTIQLNVQAQQAEDPALPGDEKLSSFELSSLSSEGRDSVEAQFMIITESGATASATLEV